MPKGTTISDPDRRPFCKVMMCVMNCTIGVRLYNPKKRNLMADYDDEDDVPDADEVRDWMYADEDSRPGDDEDF